jgi:alkylation response protein AidB-like acyl-CoA dehydrogenase
MDSTGVNRYFRDARTNMIAEASSEIHYDIISGAIQGIDPAFAGG